MSENTINLGFIKNRRMELKLTLADMAKALGFASGANYTSMKVVVINSLQTCCPYWQVY